MKNFLYICILALISFSATTYAQLIQNEDGTFNIGTLDSTGAILQQDVSSVDLEKQEESRIVTLDGDKKTITSSEVEVESLNNDQVIEATDVGASIVDVSAFFQTAYTTQEEAREAIKKELQNEVQQALDALEEKTGVENPDTLSSVIEKRSELFRDIDAYFATDAFITDPDAIADLNKRINETFNDIEGSINTDTEEYFTFTRGTLNDTLLAYRATLAERTKLLQNRSVEVTTDSDGDGLSDFDEVYIYKTNPNNAFTVPGKLNDKEKILAGIDPLSETGEKIVYEDPRMDKDAVEVMSYAVLGVDFIAANQTANGIESLTLRGSALPRSLVTIYIFSSPIVITTETDAEGRWTHTLGRPLPDGDHAVYVTTTDNKGRILAKSTPVSLTKSAQAAAIGVLVAQPTSTYADSFLEQYSLLILLILFMAGVIVTVSLIISSRKEAEKEKVFIPIHPGATAFIPDQESSRASFDDLYPALDKSKKK